MRIDDSEKLQFLEIEVRNVLNSNFRDVYNSGTYYQFRCHVCGDSKRDDRLKRGYILRNKIPWVYYCHNCFYKTSVENWLKTHFPSNYKAYLRQLMGSLGPSRRSSKTSPTRAQENISEEMIDTYDPVKEKEAVSHFKSVMQFPKWVKYCDNRKIPKDVYSRWFVSLKGAYRNRVIIPFYDHKGNWYYYQGRAFHDYQIPKYKSRTGIKHNNIYNYYNVDKTLPVVMFEGPIDSVFVENAVGLTGLKIEDPRLKDFPHKYFFLDNDDPGKSQSRKLLDNGEYAFCWDKFLKDYPCRHPKKNRDVKDVNEFIMYNSYGINYIKFDMIEKYFYNRMYYKLFFL
jgi:hypothetical protein